MSRTAHADEGLESLDVLDHTHRAERVYSVDPPTRRRPAEGPVLPASASEPRLPWLQRLPRGRRIMTLAALVGQPVTPLPRGEHMTELPKYSRLEIERRWLADLSAIDVGTAPFREIDDLYIADSRLRLRRISSPTEVVFKLAKKYGKFTATSEPITNLYLSESEYDRLAALPGHRVRKRRYSLPLGSLDVYVAPYGDFAVFEVEFLDELAAREFETPSFVRREVTNDSAFSGFSLAERHAVASQLVADDDAPRRDVTRSANEG